MKHLLKWVVAALTLVSSAWAATPDGTVRMVSDSVVQRLIAEHTQIKANPQRIEEIVTTLALPFFDTETFAKRVLAKHWKVATPEQQKQFTVEFTAFMVRFYSKAFATYNGEVIEVNPVVETNDKGIAQVKTYIVRKTGGNIPVNYQMQPQQDGSFKIIDVVVEGISLVQSKRDEYGGVITSQGLDKLIADLAAKNQSAKKPATN